LVDGNNTLASKTDLRYFFQSKKQRNKASSQIRLKFLMAGVIEGFLFFDEFFGKEINSDV